MIVQCDSCNSRYRIAEEKVLPQGIKVRCAKCQNVFVVKPSADAPSLDKPPPEAPPEKASPQKAADDKPASEPAPPEPPIEKAKAPELPPEKPPEKPSAPPPLPPPGAKGPEPPVTSPEPAEKPSGSVEIDEALSALIGTATQEDEFQPATPDFTAGLEDKGSEPSPPDTEDAATEAPSTTPEGGIPPLTDTPATRQTPAREAESPGLPDPGSKPGADEPLPPLGQDIGSGSPDPGSAPQDPESMDWGNIALDAEEQQAQAGSEIDIAPPDPASLDDLDEPPKDEEVASYSKPSTGKLKKPDTKARPPRKERRGLRLLLLLVLLVAAVYYSYPRIRSLLPSKTAAEQGDLAVESVQVSTLNREDGTLLATIRGQVRNTYSSNKGMIQVEAIFKGSGGRELAKAAAYCGNLLTDSELASRDLSSIRTALNNELGQSLSNSSIAPENTVPFLIVMENPPLDSREVTVKILKFSDTP